MKKKNHKKQINALIPIASKRAKKRVRELRGITEVLVIGIGGNIYPWDFFTEYFHEEMNKMAKEKGLRVV